MNPLTVREDPYQYGGQSMMMPQANQEMMQLAPMEYNQSPQMPPPQQEASPYRAGYPDFDQDPYMSTLDDMYQKMVKAGNIDGANAVSAQAMQFMDPYTQLKLNEMGGGAGGQDPQQQGSEMIAIGQSLLEGGNASGQDYIDRGDQMLRESLGMNDPYATGGGNGGGGGEEEQAQENGWNWDKLSWLGTPFAAPLAAYKAGQAGREKTTGFFKDHGLDLESYFKR